MKPTRLKASFLFHCAFAHRPGAPFVDVLLSPNDPKVHGKKMKHIAGLRIPEACVADDSLFPGTEQRTETLEGVSMDLIWDLHGYDLWIDAPDGVRPGDEIDDGDGQTARGWKASNMMPEVVDDTGTTWVIASFKELAGVGISDRFVKAVPAPDLFEGARVRVFGGLMRCGTPDKGLKTRRWKIDGRDNLGLSDRMEFEKELKSDDTIRLQFRKFEGDTSIKTVLLRPDPKTGIIRMHVTNDPTADEIHGLGAVDPCESLPHFASYGMLLADRPNQSLRVPIGLPTPRPHHVAGMAPRTVLEGESLCCPCGGAPPEP